jgi:hypothetical protein
LGDLRAGCLTSVVVADKFDRDRHISNSGTGRLSSTPREQLPLRAAHCRSPFLFGPVPVLVQSISLTARLGPARRVALTIFLSYGTYHLIEIPGRIWLRRSLGAAIDAAFGRTATLAAKGSTVLQLAKAKRVSFGLCVALVLAIVSLSGQAVRSDRVVGHFHLLLHGKRPDIVVISASYGLNCRTDQVKPPTGNSPALGNVSTKIRRLCRFSTICNLQLDVRWLGDPAPGCAKDFDVAYRCGDPAEPVTRHVEAEASGNSIVLKCPETTINSGT